MIKKTYTLWLAVFGLIFIISSSFAEDNYYLLKNGASALDAGKLPEAIGFYHQYIENHPATTDLYSEDYQNRKQYYLRNLLIAYKNLLGIYQKTGDQINKDIWLDHLQSLVAQRGLGAKNLYQAGWILHENQREDTAAGIFEKIVSEQCQAYDPLHNKAVLRSCRKLIEIYKQKGDLAKREKLLFTMRSHFPTKDFDPRDLYRLAVIYLDCGLKQEGEKILKQIAKEDDFSATSPYIHARMDAYSRLLESAYIYDKQSMAKSQSESTLEKWILHLSRHYPIEALPPNTAYKLAVRYLKCERRDEAIQLLEYITQNHSGGATGRKALFLLGRVAQNVENWDKAIAYFESYIYRYPDPPFFALKAYSRMIDAHFSKNADFKIAQEHSLLLADIVNQVADYETQLNLARDLKWMGMDQLASATFNLGASAAEKDAKKHAGSYEALRIRWQLTKYAQALERSDIAEENGKIALDLSQQLKQEKTKGFYNNPEKIRYIESQIYLWLAKIYEEQERFDEAVALLRLFLTKYPDDKEWSYAGYALGQVLEKLGRIQEATDIYSGVPKGMWKEKSRKRLMELSSDSGM